MGADILTEIRAAGITLSVDGGNLVATPKVALTDKLRSLIRAHKSTLLKAIAHPDQLPPLPPAAASRRQRVLALLDRNGGTRYAMLVEDASADPVIVALAVRDKDTGEVQIPRHRYDAFRILELVKEWEGQDATVTPIAGVPKPRAPVNLDEALAAACDGVGGITKAQFRALLSPEDLIDIEAGGLHPRTLGAYAMSFVEGLRLGRIVVPGGEP